ncbi:DDE transposase [Candidatus Williamhamiltonella defendens]|uniref:Transposase DDE domain-containing protein n=1 Tax=Candidatus Hamiltonella defensa (Bemisia tabaci) TaxID=672795 RepID=A0A249DYV5_9ENTR|nr:DDE transposase [Candidatus Hamiltonella defensa]ASX26723.1 hypothetical protein BA171_06765 [Candidatus Hamiltonella defensa (Bemisia tabaci)]
MPFNGWGGYRGDRFALSSKLLCGATVQVAQRHQWQTFTVIPERWVVERALSWFEKCRTKTQYQRANGQFGFLGGVLKKNLNRSKTLPA